MGAPVYQNVRGCSDLVEGWTIHTIFIVERDAAGMTEQAPCSILRFEAAPPSPPAPMRRYRRFLLAHGARSRWYQGEASVLDISMGGARLRSPNAPKKGEHIRLALELPHCAPYMPEAATVYRAACRDGWEWGVSFSECPWRLEGQFVLSSLLGCADAAATVIVWGDGLRVIRMISKLAERGHRVVRATSAAEAQRAILREDAALLLLSEACDPEASIALTASLRAQPHQAPPVLPSLERYLVS